MSVFNKPWGQILTFVIAALIVNVVSYALHIYGKRIHHGSYTHNKLIPPGFVIAIIWVVLFGFFGYAHYLTYTAHGGWCVASVAIIVFAVYCLLYPFLVAHSEKRARLMNYIAFVLAFVVGLLVLEQSQTAFYYLIPVIAWTGYINFVDMMHINEHCMMDGVKIV